MRCISPKRSCRSPPKTYADDADTPVFHHVGVYAYRPDALSAYPSWPVGPLEQLEGLEQLRFMENGRSVLCVEVEAKGRQFWELNNPEDVPKIEAMMAEMGFGMTRTSVSVVVVSRARPDALTRCISGLAQVQYQPFEIIVVADPSGIESGRKVGLRRVPKACAV